MATSTQAAYPMASKPMNLTSVPPMKGATAAPTISMAGVPATVFRYDLIWEFVSAITEGRAAVPSFYEGLRAQVIADAVLQSQSQRTWIAIADEPR